MKSTQLYKSYKEFWPSYVLEHRHPVNRFLHFVGATFGFFCFSTFLITFDWRLIIFGFAAVYGSSLIGHFLIEKNRPSTFRHFFWGLASDWRMWALMLAGKMQPELEMASKVQGTQGNK